jgi:hypothetical protein
MMTGETDTNTGFKVTTPIERIKFGLETDTHDITIGMTSTGTTTMIVMTTTVTTAMTATGTIAVIGMTAAVTTTTHIVAIILDGKP